MKYVFLDEMLISAIMPIMSIYRLPQGQYGYSGHVINLPPEVHSYATSLLWLPSELYFLVRKGANQSHRDFRVRRYVVSCALQWLITNNKYYIANQVRIDQGALEILPQDEKLSNIHYIRSSHPYTKSPAGVLRSGL